MKKYGSVIWVIALLFVSMSACVENKEVIEEIVPEITNLKSGHLGEWVYNSDNNWFYSTHPGEIEVCEEGDTYPFFNSAMVSIFNDDDFLYVKVKANEGASIMYLSMNMYSEDESPYYGYWGFPYQTTFSKEELIDCLVYKFPMEEEWSECLKLNIKIKTYHPELKFMFWWLTNDNEKGQDYYIDYCWKECNPCPPQKIGDIVAAQHHNVGDLVVWEDDEYLYINYDLEEGFNLDEAHVYVGCIDKMPATKNGNPKNGNFPYHIDDFNGNVLMIPIADLEDVCKDANGCWPIAAHGVVSKTMGNKTWSETSWSTGTKFDAKRWGWYSTYCPCE